MKLTVKVALTKEQENLLLKISLEEGYEPLDKSEQEDDDLTFLCEKGLIDSVLGEQFYITDLGKQYLNKIGL